MSTIRTSKQTASIQPLIDATKDMISVMEKKILNPSQPITKYYNGEESLCMSEAEEKGLVTKEQKDQWNLDHFFCVACESNSLKYVKLFVALGANVNKFPQIADEIGISYSNWPNKEAEQEAIDIYDYLISMGYKPTKEIEERWRKE